MAKKIILRNNKDIRLLKDIEDTKGIYNFVSSQEKCQLLIDQKNKLVDIQESYNTNIIFINKEEGFKYMLDIDMLVNILKKYKTNNDKIEISKKITGLKSKCFIFFTNNSLQIINELAKKLDSAKKNKAKIKSFSVQLSSTGIKRQIDQPIKDGDSQTKQEKN